MTPVELLTPFRQEKLAKFSQILEAYTALRNQGASKQIAKSKVANQLGISVSGVDYALRQTSK
ncbi:hypothetical protein [Siphonobacter sp. SORGH_AS_1065]|uniref:hypothetical protein n=1 Tax=Siphonobacter sp. SORGH_AS_1065 TaxID=3041795 RepID=UPI00277EF8BF|nr:hypothetical protein [Siphonobacter sp. SORGH_AS_1065]MDQ1088605.1 hypothetical protein [Siphonobacter sp. SORGH_AS_1065]